MAKNKYRVREYTPQGNQSGVHSFYAEAVTDNEIDNLGLAKKIAARTGFKSYECQAVVSAIADIVLEEVLENNRVILANEDGTNLVSFYPRVTGSVTDTQVAANPTKFGGASVATEAMVTPDLLQWSLGASVGIKYSKQFALQKQAEKVAYRPTDEEEAEPTAEPTTPTGGNQGGNPGSGDDGMS